MSRDRDRKIDELVAAWDPLGLIEMGAPSDEYDCMTQPLASLLDRHASEAEIIEWLKDEFVTHFGIAGPGVDSLRTFARKLEAIGRDA